MLRTPINKTIEKIGETVEICGWVRNVRMHSKKLAFVDVRDYSGLMQVVMCIPPATAGDGGQPDSWSPSSLGVEDAVRVIGLVQNRKPGTENPEMETGLVELYVDKREQVEVLAKAEPLPIDMGAKELNVELPALLDYRALTLRHPKVQAIFKVQEIIVDAFREALKTQGFTEFTAPAVVPAATEGGAEVFKINYFGKEAFLGQSPQFYKQIMVGAFDRAFTVGKVYRAEPSVTTRHLTEYLSLDAEFGFINDYTEVMDMVEYVIRYIFTSLEAKGAKYLEMYGATVPKLADKIPSITMRDAQEVIYKETGRDIRKEPDLDPQGEKDICAWALKTYGSELIFVTGYPTAKRPFYTFPDPANPEVTQSFDLIGRGVEWVTGGRRINNYQQLVANARKWGNSEESLGIYLQAFKYGMPPEGGFALGAERITMHVLGLGNIREASAFPRDMERVDIRK